MATGASVKTEKLPFTYQKKGRWYFRGAGSHVPLAGEPFNDDFVGHHAELCRVFGIPWEVADGRKVYFMGSRR